ncbi:DUF2171 domain-containing protein [Thermomicrobiaceae bacterium CFH 74404]|uniref:DUF2171 domain-containing protein n=2 Tax=Thermomicrobia TaxID=189775 RepID=A0AA41WDZ1_9BACT|nr:DUF2171 domain-containing protein [Thermalbibacter longus]MCM8748280.1 DUF2171 domain-containing protein [Thermalbibacter longus]
MIDQMRLRPGMEVLAADGDELGWVKDVRSTDFLLERSMQRDVYVPFDAIRDISSDRIVLNVASDQVDSMGWENPPMSM